MLDILAAFLVTRVTLVIVAGLAVSAIPISSAIPTEWLRSGLNPIFESFSRWDSLHYLDIAWGGYRTSDPSSPAFFPLFPMYLVLAILGRRTAVHETLLVVGMGLGGIFMVLYAQWYWVA